MSHHEKPDEAPTPRTDALENESTWLNVETREALAWKHARELEHALAAAQSALRDSQSEAGQLPPEANELAVMARDAARYRWLRNESHDVNSCGLEVQFFDDSLGMTVSGPELDAAIDAARGRSGGSEQG